ncbi:TetR/AcrR family transcriptional regulator [Chloroflexota bacterium]
MNGFEKRKERKKEDIRHAAIELFSKYGFGRVSVNDIAREAGVSHVTVYNHFGSKEKLVYDVIQTEIDRLMERSREIIRGDLPYMEKLEGIVFNKADLASHYNGEMMKEALRNSPQMYKYINDLWQNETNQLVIELVEEGKELGYINKEISQEAIAYYFEMIRAGAFASSEMLSKIKIDAKLARDLNNLFLFGLIEKKK